MESEFGTQDILTGRGLGLGGFGGYGYGQGQEMGNSVLAAEAHANGTATGANIDNLTNATNLNFDSVEEQIRESRNIGQFSELRDNGFRAELRTSDKIADLAKEVNLNAREMDRCCCSIEKSVAEAAKDAAKCCCEAQVLALQNQAKTDASLATVLANQDCVSKVSDAVSNAVQNSKLDRLLHCPA